MDEILIDTNVWLAASFDSHLHHNICRQFLVENAPKVRLCRAVQQSWLQLLSTPTVQKGLGSDPIDNTQAIEIVSAFTQSLHISKITKEPDRLERLWTQFASAPTASPKVWMDAFFAAFAICSNMAWATLDSDFHRFTAHGLKLIDLTA